MESFKTEQNSRKTIKCPHCGFEYLPGEIFYPNDLTGELKYNSIIRDPLGKILYEEYKEDGRPVTEEHFTCENCGKPFIINVETKYSTKVEDEDKDFTSVAKLF